MKHHHEKCGFIPVALQEASHSIFQFNCEKSPKWLNEGLAEFFETLDFDSEGNLYSYPQGNRIKSIKAGLAYNDTERLKTFFRIYDATFYGHGIDDNYNTAYSMIYYFVKNKSTTALKNIIRLLHRVMKLRKPSQLLTAALIHLKPVINSFITYIINY